MCTICPASGWSLSLKIQCFTLIKKGGLIFLILRNINGGVVLSLKPVGVTKLIRLGWDCIQPDSSHLIYFTSKIWSWKELWAKDIPEKAIWVLFTWTVVQNHKSPLQFRRAMHSERGGYIFCIKDKSRMLPRILKDSSRAWQPDLELMIWREIFNESEFLVSQLSSKADTK